jgi:hypothetical protein
MHETTWWVRMVDFTIHIFGTDMGLCWLCKPVLVFNVTDDNSMDDVPFGCVPLDNSIWTMYRLDV